MRELEAKLDTDIEELLRQAEEADQAGEKDGSEADREQRRYDSRPARKKSPKKITNPRLLAMSAKIGSSER